MISESFIAVELNSTFYQRLLRPLAMHAICRPWHLFLYLLVKGCRLDMRSAFYTSMMLCDAYLNRLRYCRVAHQATTIVPMSAKLRQLRGTARHCFCDRGTICEQLVVISDALSKGTENEGNKQLNLTRSDCYRIQNI